MDIRLYPTDNWKDVISGHMRKGAVKDSMMAIRMRNGYFFSILQLLTDVIIHPHPDTIDLTTIDLTIQLISQLINDIIDR